MKTDYSSILGVIAIAAALLAPAAPATAGLLRAPPPVTGSIDPVSGYLSTSAPLRHSYTRINGVNVQTAAGTKAYSATIVVGAQTRRYLVLRPDPAPALAPALLLLHPNSTAPETIANLTEVADYVATQGFWAVMPEAIGGKWQDDPSTAPNDDVRFIAALVDTLAAQGVDATRTYAAGYSSGGFMSERLACELSDKIAAFGIDAATLRSGLASGCAPAKQRSKQYFLGTADNIVPYDGIANLKSAAATMAFWTPLQKCGGTLASTLPDRVNDGTTVQLTDYTGCAATRLQLYTIYGGGHAWPGGLTGNLYGPTTQDIKATGLIWLFVRGERR